MIELKADCCCRGDCGGGGLFGFGEWTTISIFCSSTTPSCLKLWVSSVFSSPIHWFPFDWFHWFPLIGFLPKSSISAIDDFLLSWSIELSSLDVLDRGLCIGLWRIGVEHLDLRDLREHDELIDPFSEGVTFLGLQQTFSAQASSKHANKHWFSSSINSSS